jgi:hypothetical protein
MRRREFIGFMGRSAIAFFLGNALACAKTVKHPPKKERQKPTAGYDQRTLPSSGQAMPVR